MLLFVSLVLPRTLTASSHDHSADQHDRRIALLGRIHGKHGLLIIERAAFATESPEALRALHAAITRVRNLGNNDIYHWYMASTSSPSSNNNSGEEGEDEISADLKINLIWPCTEEHIRKYSTQTLRMVTETPQIYREYVRPYMERKRAEGRLNWVYNILEGRSEQENVIARDYGTDNNNGEGGFHLLPDLNWDRKTMGALHLLALVHRRDIWSLRDLRKKDVPYLESLRERVLDATVKAYPELETDQLKLYVHYQPTYYHFHIHVVNVMLEAGMTQSVGKAFGLENLIAQLRVMEGGPETGLADVSLSYVVGDESELWREIFGPLKAKS